MTLRRPWCVQALFKNYDDTLLDCLKPHVERLVNDTSHDTHETSQRCAAEIIAGLIRGSKHWSYVKVCSLAMCACGRVTFDALFPQIDIIGATMTVWREDYQICSVAAAVHSAIHTHMNRPDSYLLVRFSFSYFIFLLSTCVNSAWPSLVDCVVPVNGEEAHHMISPC